MSKSSVRHVLKSTSISAFAIMALVAGVLVSTSTAGTAGVPVKERHSPIGATANGPSGPATAKFTVGPYCCPSTAIVLTPTAVSTENDFQWLDLGLPSDNKTITSVEVCYTVSPPAAAGRTYISQTRLTEMTTPNSATVRLDDGTNRTSTTPNCYTVPANVAPTGSVAIELKVVFGSTGDRINVGMIALNGTSE
jgi:hypothetical protein